MNEEALVKLGAEKLARLLLAEAKRDVAFRKLVAASLAAIIDKRLAGLDRAKAFVDWDKAKDFTADIAATLATITGELAAADPGAAVDRLVRFLSTADRVFKRIDDSSGRLQDVYHEAAAALPDLVGRLEEVDKASIPDRLFALSPAYGHAARYLEKLDALAEHDGAASPIASHETYRAAVAKKHGRKIGFWSLVKERK